MNNNIPFNALIVSEVNDRIFTREVKRRHTGDLPDHDVLIRVHYSSLNYKDALSASGNKGVTRHYPHTPGIDAAGVVESSDDTRFKPGEKVIVTSYDLGQDTPGGFGQYIRVPGDWIVPLPDGLTTRESMILGTAGFTAAYGVYKIKHNHIKTGDGPVLVTGATGGVGSMGIALLAQEGYRVIAATGKQRQKGFLMSLGASEVVTRDDVFASSPKSLLPARWAGALDTVGGSMLDATIRQTQHNGSVACCGNILGHKLETSIYPFILRGVSLIGIDSGICLMPMRKKIWALLAGKWKPEFAKFQVKEYTIGDLNKKIDQMLEGKQTGRVLISLQ